MVKCIVCGEIDGAYKERFCSHCEFVVTVAYNNQVSYRCWRFPQHLLVDPNGFCGEYRKQIAEAVTREWHGRC